MSCVARLRRSACVWPIFWTRRVNPLVSQALKQRLVERRSSPRWRQGRKSATRRMPVRAPPCQPRNTRAMLTVRCRSLVAGVEDKPGDTRSQGGGKRRIGSADRGTPAAGSLPREQAESEYRKAIAAVNQGRVPEALDSLRTALRLDAFGVAARQRWSSSCWK